MCTTPPSKLSRAYRVLLTAYKKLAAVQPKPGLPPIGSFTDAHGEHYWTVSCEIDVAMSASSRAKRGSNSGLRLIPV